MGGTMRLGSRRTYFQVQDCKSAKLYEGVSYVDERHRHRYEVNPDMVMKLEKAGLLFVGKDESGNRMEILELPTHPYYIGVQFHPEFKSRPGRPSPLFFGLIKASCGQLNAWFQSQNPIPGAVNNKPSKPRTITSNAVAKPKIYQNGNTKKLLNGTYYNGNGVHA